MGSTNTEKVDKKADLALGNLGRWKSVGAQQEAQVLTKITIAKKIAVPTDKAWEAIRKIGRLDVWFPSIATCIVKGDGIGAQRHMTLRRGGDITDRIVDINAVKRRLIYQRIESPFPVTSYTGTVEVFDSFDSQAIIVWTVDFDSDPKDSSTVAEALRAGIGAGVDGMEKDLQTAMQ